MTMTLPTAAEAISQNRLNKALQIAKVLKEAGATSYTLTVMKESQWVAAARCANVSLASRATKALVARLFDVQEAA
jgi:hypothetical protein